MGGRKEFVKLNKMGFPGNTRMVSLNSRHLMNVGFKKEELTGELYGKWGVDSKKKRRLLLTIVKTIPSDGEATYTEKAGELKMAGEEHELWV